MDDPIGSFLGWAKFPLGKVFGCQGDFMWDEVPYVKLSELHSLVVVLVEYLSSDAGYSYLDWDYFLGAVSEFERGFSCWDSCCSPVSPQDIGQFLGPGSFSIVQLGFDDFEYYLISHLRLSVCLWMSWG